MEFYRRRGVYLQEREACAIVRRVDASCSGRISFGDFAEYFANCLSPKAPLKIPKTQVNPERSPQKLLLKLPVKVTSEKSPKKGIKSS